MLDSDPLFPGSLGLSSPIRSLGLFGLFLTGDNNDGVNMNLKPRDTCLFCLFCPSLSLFSSLFPFPSTPINAGSESGSVRDRRMIVGKDKVRWVSSPCRERADVMVRAIGLATDRLVGLVWLEWPVLVDGLMSGTRHSGENHTYHMSHISRTSSVSIHTSYIMFTQILQGIQLDHSNGNGLFKGCLWVIRAELRITLLLQWITSNVPSDRSNYTYIRIYQGYQDYQDYQDYLKTKTHITSHI